MTPEQLQVSGRGEEEEMKIKKKFRTDTNPKSDDRCIACNGSGNYDWADPKTGKIPKCSSCGGTGKENGR